MGVGAETAHSPFEEAPVVFEPRRKPLPPNTDPFYRPPVGWERAVPGTVFHARRVRIALMGVVPQRITAWQLLYRTSDLNLQPDTTVVTVLWSPETRTPASPVVSMQAAIDAVSPRCFPSYALQRGARAFGSVPQFELLLAGGALARGWVVCIADHEGAHGAFGAPREPGYRALDGIRAALGYAPLELAPTTPVALYGYSGGGMATAWTAEMAAGYAPELRIVGAAAGAPVGDPVSTFVRLDRSLYSGLPALVLAGLRRTSPELDAVLTEHLTPAGHRRLGQLSRRSTVAAVVLGARMDWDRLTTIPMREILARPDMLALFDELRLGNNAPAMPLLVVQSVLDQVINVDDVDAQVARYRAAGTHTTYVRDTLSEHLSLAIIAAPLMFDWLADRFADTPLSAAPVTETVPSLLFSARTLRQLAALAGTVVRMALARPLIAGTSAASTRVPLDVEPRPVPDPTTSAGRQLSA